MSLAIKHLLTVKIEKKHLQDPDGSLAIHARTYSFTELDKNTIAVVSTNYVGIVYVCKRRNVNMAENFYEAKIYLELNSHDGPPTNDRVNYWCYIARPHNFACEKGSYLRANNILIDVMRAFLDKCPGVKNHKRLGCITLFDAQQNLFNTRMNGIPVWDSTFSAPRNSASDYKWVS